MSDPLPLRHAHLEVAPSVRLHYVESGAGPLVLLLPGFPDFWFGWRRQIPALVAAGFRIVAPGEPAHVVGHDWGAGVAWSFAMAHPERLRQSDTQ